MRPQFNGGTPALFITAKSAHAAADRLLHSVDCVKRVFVSRWSAAGTGDRGFCVRVHLDDGQQEFVTDADWDVAQSSLAKSIAVAAVAVCKRGGVGVIKRGLPV